MANANMGKEPLVIHNWLTIPDAARAASVSQRTIYRWINTGLRTRTTCGTTYVYVPHLVTRFDNTKTNVRESR